MKAFLTNLSQLFHINGFAGKKKGQGERDTQRERRRERERDCLYNRLVNLFYSHKIYLCHVHRSYKTHREKCPNIILFGKWRKPGMLLPYCTCI